MRHFILPRPVFACPVAARSRRMPDPAATARLIAPPRCMQRPATRVGPTVGAVDVAPIAIAADEHLNGAVGRGEEKRAGSHPLIRAATAALVMRPPMAWTRA